MDDLIANLYRWHREAHEALTTFMSGFESGSTSVITPILFAFTLGVLHALTPGHGKAVVVSYFLGREARLFAGILAGLKIAAGHVLLATALVAIFGTVVSVMGKPAGAAAVLQSLAYFIIAASGAWLLYKSLRPVKQGYDHSHSHSHNHYHHEHHNAPTLAGLIPCPLTMILLTYALAMTSLVVSIALLVALGIGIAATIALFGLLAISARKLLVSPFDPESGWYPRLSKVLEIGSSAVILLVGLALLFGVVI